jgi:hypothetical protein
LAAKLLGPLDNEADIRRQVCDRALEQRGQLVIGLHL